MQPDSAKQIADKLIKRDEVDILTGIIWSNLALAVVPSAVGGRRLLHQPQRRPVAARRPGLPRELLQRRLAERQPARGDGPVRLRQRLCERLHPGAQLSGRQRCARGLQALLQGRARRRDLHPARPDRLCRRDRRDPRGRARFGLLLPARRHGHRLHEAVRPVRRSDVPVFGPAFSFSPGHPGRGRRRRARRQEHLAMVEGPRQPGQRRSSSPPSRRPTAACRRSMPARATTPRGCSARRSPRPRSTIRTRSARRWRRPSSIACAATSRSARTTIRSRTSTSARWSRRATC